MARCQSLTRLVNSFSQTTARFPLTHFALHWWKFCLRKMFRQNLLPFRTFQLPSAWVNDNQHGNCTDHLNKFEVQFVFWFSLVTSEIREWKSSSTTPKTITVLGCERHRPRALFIGYYSVLMLHKKDQSLPSLALHLLMSGKLKLLGPLQSFRKVSGLLKKRQHCYLNYRYRYCKDSRTKRELSRTRQAELEQLGKKYNWVAAKWQSMDSSAPEALDQQIRSRK